MPPLVTSYFLAGFKKKDLLDQSCVLLSCHVPGRACLFDENKVVAEGGIRTGKVAICHILALNFPDTC